MNLSLIITKAIVRLLLIFNKEIVSDYTWAAKSIQMALNVVFLLGLLSRSPKFNVFYWYVIKPTRQGTLNWLNKGAPVLKQLCIIDCLKIGKSTFAQ